MLLKFSDFDLSNGVNSTDFVPTDRKPKSDCLLFDTTNYYTFMSSHTDSELSRRGKNKAG
jgi:hypothetical protein